MRQELELLSSQEIIRYVFRNTLLIRYGQLFSECRIRIEFQRLLSVICDMDVLLSFFGSFILINFKFFVIFAAADIKICHLIAVGDRLEKDFLRKLTNAFFSRGICNRTSSSSSSIC